MKGKRVKRTIIILAAVMVIIGVRIYAYFTSSAFIHRELAALVIEVEHRDYIRSAAFSTYRWHPDTDFNVKLVAGLSAEQILALGQELMESIDRHIYYGMDETLRGSVNVGRITMFLESQDDNRRDNGLNCTRYIEFADYRPDYVMWSVLNLDTRQRGAAITSPYGHTLPADWLN